MLKIRSLVVALVLHSSGVALADDTQQTAAREAPRATALETQQTTTKFGKPLAEADFAHRATASSARAELATAPKSTATPTGDRYPSCTSEPDAQSIQAARGAFEAGKAAFEEGDYDRAITYWEDAYRRDCTAHAMLKNLARAYELNDQHQRAIHALQTYLSRTPGAPDHEALERRIANLKEKQAEVDAIRRAAARAQAAKSTARTRTHPNPRSEHPLPADDIASPRTGRSPWPLVVAGGGIVLTGLGTVQWLRARSDARDAARDCLGDRKNCGNQAAVERGNQAVTRERAWGAVTGVGVATLAGGVLWYFLQPREEPTAELAPSVGPDYAALVWSGHF